MKHYLYLLTSVHLIRLHIILQTYIHHNSKKKLHNLFITAILQRLIDRAKQTSQVIISISVSTTLHSSRQRK